jgi:hypothetical protein
MIHIDMIAPWTGDGVLGQLYCSLVVAPDLYASALDVEVGE